MDDAISPIESNSASRKDVRRRLAANLSSVNHHIGDRLKMRRKFLRLSQTSLGNTVGLSFQQVQKYEHGSNRIGAALLYQLSAVLNVPVSYFFENMPAVPPAIDFDNTAIVTQPEHTLTDLPESLQKQIMDLVLSISKSI